MSVRKDREERGEEGTCWDEHWVLHGNQLDNKFHTKKKKTERKRTTVKSVGAANCFSAIDFLTLCEMCFSRLKVLGK